MHTARVIYVIISMSHLVYQNKLSLFALILLFLYFYVNRYNIVYCMYLYSMHKLL